MARGLRTNEVLTVPSTHKDELTYQWSIDAIFNVTLPHIHVIKNKSLKRNKEKDFMLFEAPEEI